jgi:hypothetical protein
MAHPDRPWDGPLPGVQSGGWWSRAQAAGGFRDQEAADVQGLLLILISVLLIFADQLVNKFLGATDRTITVAMSAYLFFGVGHLHHPHPTGTRLYDFKLNTSVLHRVIAKFIKMPGKLSDDCVTLQRESGIKLDVRAKG